MKTATQLVLMLIPYSVFAQQYPDIHNSDMGEGMNKQEQQKIIQQLEKMQACMHDIEPNEMKKLENSSIGIELEIESLCAGGCSKRGSGQSGGILQ